MRQNRNSPSMTIVTTNLFLSVFILNKCISFSLTFFKYCVGRNTLSFSICFVDSTRKKIIVNPCALLCVWSQKQYYYCCNQLLSFRKHLKPTHHRFKLDLSKFTLSTYEQNSSSVKNREFLRTKPFWLNRLYAIYKQKKNPFYFRNTSVKFILIRSLGW